MAAPQALVVFVDIDDTLVRSVGSKRIPIPSLVAHVKRLAEDGAVLYAWSTAGGEYAESSAAELGLAQCFRAYLPKPQVMLDDEHPSVWRRLLVVHPSEAASRSLGDYEAALQARAV